MVDSSIVHCVHQLGVQMEVRRDINTDVGITTFGTPGISKTRVVT